MGLDSLLVFPTLKDRIKGFPGRIGGFRIHVCLMGVLKLFADGVSVLG